MIDEACSGCGMSLYCTATSITGCTSAGVNSVEKTARTIPRIRSGSILRYFTKIASEASWLRVGPACGVVDGRREAFGAGLVGG